MKRKYRNTPTTIGAESYRSKREANRHQELLLLQAGGHISGLTREVVFDLAPPVVIAGRKRPPLRYIADFVYTNVHSGKVVIEDAKGVRTEGYRIKRHLMAAKGMEIVET
jgi:hypothetical protein